MSTPVEQIKERLSILDIIGQYVELHKAGKSYKGKSPFTNEKTPSFFVSPERGMYYCFSSQKGGDIFTFIQEIEGVDFKGALKILAERAHVELTPEDPKKRDELETQYALLEEATQFFWRAREENDTVNTYIANRGVKSATIHTWRIGYAKDEWRALKGYLLSKGFSEQAMFDAGLIKHADERKESYDVFRDRIMFPIADASGRIVAFSGRTLKLDSKTPKYVNSPETKLFQKSEILYGYDRAKHGIRHYDFSLVVEGQFDLVLAHQAGYANTVAVSGTALTAHHRSLLMRLSNRVVLSLDADRAGISAMKRSALPMLEDGMDVKVARMPDGEDPADVVKRDQQEFKTIVGRATHVIEFMLAVLKNGMKDERTYKLRVREELLPLVVAIQNHIDREHFEGVIADAIGTTKEAIHFEVGRIIMEQEHQSIKTTEKTANEKTILPARRHTLAQYVLALHHMLPPEHSWIQTRIEEALAPLLTEDEKRAYTRDDDSAWQKMLFDLETQLETADERKIIEDASEQLTILSHLIARERLSVLRDSIMHAERAGDDARVMEYVGLTKEAEQLLQKNILFSKETPE